MSEDKKLTGYTSIDKPYLDVTPTYKYNKDYCKKTAYEMMISSPCFNPNSKALSYYGAVITNDTMINNINILSAAFKNYGIKRNDIVFMLCLNTPEMIYALYALNKIGAISEWFNPTSISADMLKRQIIDNNIKTIFAIDVMYPILKEAIKDTDVECVIINSVKDSFNFISSFKYNLQVYGLNAVNSSRYFMKKLELVNELLPNVRVTDSREKEIKQLSKIQKLILDIADYSNQKKIQAKASYYLDKNKGSIFISYKDFIKRYYSDNKNINTYYEDDKTSIIVHTGGTTGPVKRVAMTDYNLNSAIYQASLLPLNMDFNDSFCQLIPPIVAWSLEGIHTARYYNMLSHLICTYDRSEFVDIMLKTKANHYFTVPSFVKTIIDNPKLCGKDLSFVKTINHGGEALSKEDDKAIDDELKKHNCFIKNQFGYGQNEEFGCFTINLDVNGVSKEYACCGIPFPENDYIIYDLETHEEMKYGKNDFGEYNIGELLVSGPTTMKGYIGDDAYLNSTTIVHYNGKRYIDTGDQAYIDENGRLWYYTRNSRIIRTQDGKIFTNVIENIINELDEVVECCVVASPHPEKDKEASCHIVLKEKYKKLPQNELNSLINHIIEEVENKTSKMYTYYIPGTYEFGFLKLPITPFGKIDFKMLEQLNIEQYKKNGNLALKKIRLKSS